MEGYDPSIENNKAFLENCYIYYSPRTNLYYIVKWIWTLTRHATVYETYDYENIPPYKWRYYMDVRVRTNEHKRTWDIYPRGVLREAMRLT